jgi:hypothetical protein
MRLHKIQAGLKQSKILLSQMRTNCSCFNNRENCHSSQEILMRSPTPLFSSQHQLAVFWSAKAGCTFICKWFFYQIGLLDTALSFNPWVHHFRINTFYKQDRYKKSICELLDGQVRIIKLVRNPYARAVSSYIHAIRTQYDDKNIRKFFGYSSKQEYEFSFRDFVAFLKTTDLLSCDEHHGVQTHLSEQRGLIKPYYIIKLENSFSQLKLIEKKLGLLESNLLSLRESEHHTVRQKTKDFVGDIPFNYQNSISGNFRNFPSHECFYDYSLMKEVANLYRVDFQLYGYDTDSLS